MDNNKAPRPFQAKDLSARQYLDLFPSNMTEEQKDKLAAEMEQRYADHQTVTQDEKRFREILESTGREGVGEFLDSLKCNNFFTAPGSVSHHSNWKGGLVSHSLKVYDYAMMYRKEMLLADPSLVSVLDADSIAVASLLHDICKMDEYKIDLAGKPIRKKPYLHLGGHGTKSVIMILSRGFKLEFDEILAIRWHMGSKHIKNQRDRQECETAKNGFALVLLIIRADHDAAKN